MESKPTLYKRSLEITVGFVADTVLDSHAVMSPMNGELVIRNEAKSFVQHGNVTPLVPSEVYRLTYPYKRFDIAAQRSFVEITESVLEIKGEIENYSVYDCFDAVLFSLRCIQDTHGCNFRDKKFVDCFGFCGAGAFYAASFGFDTVLGIEFTRCGYNKAEQIRSTMYQKLGLDCTLSFEFGSFQDFMPYDAHVLFLDCTIMSTDSMLEEGVLLNSLFFPMCAKLLSGTFLVVITAITTLHTEDCARLNVPFECLQHKLVIPDNENNAADYGDKFPKTVWILKTRMRTHK